MTQFTPVSALIGGAIIGLSAVLLLRLNGRIAGVSGILNGALAQQSDGRAWRFLFVVGLVFGGGLYSVLSNQPLLTRQDFPISLLIVSGLLVGFGTRLGSGCTSGHGVCGVARLSLRSIVATVVFLTAGILTASIVFLFGSSS